MDPKAPDIDLRPFGRGGDLDFDLSQSDRPALVTALLTRCSERKEPAFWWSQPVSGRTAALLRLVALTEGRDEVSLSSRCAAACSEPFEFDLPLGSLSAFVADLEPLEARLDDGRVLRIRRPTGEDLRRWRDARPGSHDEALRLMLDSLVLTGQAGPEDERALSAAIAAGDALVDFAILCRCPVCGAQSEVTVDLEALALGLLARRQRTLVHEVHRLASQYGWTESEVLALSTTRRARYLALVEGPA